MNISYITVTIIVYVQKILILSTFKTLPKKQINLRFKTCTSTRPRFATLPSLHSFVPSKRSQISLYDLNKESDLNLRATPCPTWRHRLSSEPVASGGPWECLPSCGQPHRYKHRSNDRVGNHELADKRSPSVHCNRILNSNYMILRQSD